MDAIDVQTLLARTTPMNFLHST